MAEAEVALMLFLWASFLLPAMVSAFMFAWDNIIRHCNLLDNRRPSSQRARLRTSARYKPMKSQLPCWIRRKQHLHCRIECLRRRHNFQALLWRRGGEHDTSPQHTFFALTTFEHFIKWVHFKFFEFHRKANIESMQFIRLPPKQSFQREATGDDYGKHAQSPALWTSEASPSQRELFEFIRSIQAIQCAIHQELSEERVIGYSNPSVSSVGAPSAIPTDKPSDYPSVDFRGSPRKRPQKMTPFSKSISGSSCNLSRRSALRAAALFLPRSAEERECGNIDTARYSLRIAQGQHKHQVELSLCSELHCSGYSCLAFA